MLLRVLLIVVAAVAISMGGCKKEEPTTADSVQEDMKKQVDEAKDSDMADEAQDAAEDAAEDAEDAAEGMMK